MNTEQIKDEIINALTELGSQKGTRIGLAILNLQLLHNEQIKTLGGLLDKAYTKGYNDGVVNEPRNNPPKI